MTALELVEKRYLGTNLESEKVSGLKGFGMANALDCNCVDCGSDADCSTPW